MGIETEGSGEREKCEERGLGRKGNRKRRIREKERCEERELGRTRNGK